MRTAIALLLAGVLGGQTSPAPTTTMTPGLDVVLRTQDGRTAFHSFEPIVVEVTISSSTLVGYSIETSTMNAASLAYGWRFDHPERVVRPISRFWLAGFACCASVRKPVGRNPDTTTYDLTRDFRFPAPGRYEVRFWTRRVFRSGAIPKERGAPSPLEVTSNALSFTILPDDPEWNARRLAEIVALLDRAMAETRTDAHAEFLLGLLDTPKGVAERVNRMWIQPASEWQRDRKFGGTSGFSQALLEYTARPALVVSALEKKARQPDIPIEDKFTTVWTRLLMQRDHAEMFRADVDPFGSDPPTKKLMAASWADAVTHVVAVLEAALPSKTGLNHDVTARTIGDLRKQLADAKP